MSKTITLPAIGGTMGDGTIYAGTSPDTGRPMFTTPADAPLTITWQEAMKYAAGLKAHGHKDWRLPSRAELDVLFNNRAAIGGFDTTGSFAASWYWSSEEFEEFDESSDYCLNRPWTKSFSDDAWDVGGKELYVSVRCVRG